MSVVRVHRYNVNPANLEELLARRAQLIAGIRAGNPGLAETRLTRLDDGSYLDAWRWETAEQMQVATAAAANFPAVGATMALTENAHRAERRDRRRAVRQLSTPYSSLLDCKY